MGASAMTCQMPGGSLPPIWFLRHGETFWNAERRIQGQLESPLTERGIAEAGMQARILHPILMREHPACFASPLGRAQQTARIALEGRPYLTDPRLAEAHAGHWQGLLRAEVIDNPENGLSPDISALELFVAAPGGEDFDALSARIRDFLASLTGPSVIVGHGLWGQVLRGAVRGLPRSAMGRLPNEQGCVYALSDGAEHVLREAAAEG